MYDRVQLAAIPTVFRDILDDEGLDTANFVGTMSALLTQIHGLAGTCCGATKDDNTCWQDLSQALGVLHAYSESAVEFFCPLARDSEVLWGGERVFLPRNTGSRLTWPLPPAGLGLVGG